MKRNRCTMAIAILECIREKPRIKTHIEKATGINQNTMQLLLDFLEEKSYIQRALPKSRRHPNRKYNHYLYSFTEKGHQLFADMKETIRFFKEAELL